jgi:hypothetical protein
MKAYRWSGLKSSRETPMMCASPGSITTWPSKEVERLIVPSTEPDGKRKTLTQRNVETGRFRVACEEKRNDDALRTVDLMRWTAVEGGTTGDQPEKDSLVRRLGGRVIATMDADAV